MSEKKVDEVFGLYYQQGNQLILEMLSEQAPNINGKMRVVVFGKIEMMDRSFHCNKDVFTEKGLIIIESTLSCEHLFGKVEKEKSPYFSRKANESITL